MAVKIFSNTTAHDVLRTTCAEHRARDIITKQTK